MMDTFDPQRRVIEALRHKLSTARAAVRTLDAERQALSQQRTRLENEVARLRIAVLALSAKDDQNILARLGIDRS